MGMAKRELERLGDLQERAAGVLLKTGAIKRCILHDDVLIDQMDDEAQGRAYAIGTNMVKDGDIPGTREEFMKAIKSAIEESGDGCYLCQHDEAD